MSKFDLIGQTAGHPDGEYFGGRPITSGGFDPSGDIDWRPNSSSDEEEEE